VIFAERHKTGGLDLEAVEMALRTALHAAGAAGLSELLRLPSPAQPCLPCPCGSRARFKGLRTKPLFTVLGPAELLRPYYWCSDCHQGQFPSDAALDVEDTECSPGVRRMLALVGSECSSFERGREQMDLLAGLGVTANAVEQVTESIGASICWTTARSSNGLPGCDGLQNPDRGTARAQRRYSHPVDHSTDVRSDHTVILTAIESAKAYPDALRRISYVDAETDQRAPADQGVPRSQRERCRDWVSEGV